MQCALNPEELLAPREEPEFPGTRLGPSCTSVAVKWQTTLPRSESCHGIRGSFEPASSLG